MQEASKLPKNKTEELELARSHSALPALLWLIALPLLLLIHMVPFLKSLLCEFPSMVVHEIGHSIFAWLAGLPALSFFFLSYHFTSKPVLFFVLLLLAFEVALLLKLRSLNQHVLGGLVVICIITHFFFLLLPSYSEPCAIFGGMAGEMVLPIVLLVVFSELPHTEDLRILATILFVSVVYWNSLYEWIFAYFGYAPIPYPHDSKGMFLLADPFNSLKETPAATGDLDKLLKVFGWSEGLIKIVYLSTGISCLLLFLGYIVWRANSFELHLPKRLRRQSDQNKTQSS